MLLGECPPEEPYEEGEDGQPPPLGPSPKGLDILHATSAALIHALRDVLLDSDFENAMKALTAWIPVRDEDLLMKVASAEWKRHLGKRRRVEEKLEKEKLDKEKLDKENQEKEKQEKEKGEKERGHKKKEEEKKKEKEKKERVKKEKVEKEKDKKEKRVKEKGKEEA